MKAQNQHYHSRGFTLVEVMLVAATLGLLVTLAIPNYLRARKRAHAARLLDDLKAIDHAMVLYCVEFRRSGEEAMGPSDLAFLKMYLKDRIALYESLPNDLFNNPFVVSDLKSVPRLNVATYDALSDVAPSEYWNPYGPTP
jgi:prepilin-type N-terminal cleavage/methylation domain-containing protein